MWGDVKNELRALDKCSLEIATKIASGADDIIMSPEYANRLVGHIAAVVRWAQVILDGDE